MAAPYEGLSNKVAIPGVKGRNTKGGTGVVGESTTGRGVEGLSETWQGVYGHSVENAGVVGESDRFDGVFGVAHLPERAGVSGHNDVGTAVLGISTTGRGVAGFTQTWQGVYGHSVENAGVVGESDRFDGVFGVAHLPERAGVSGHNDVGTAVLGISTTGRGVAGFTQTWQGVYGHSVENAGVVGESDRFDGVFGVAHSRDHTGVSGHNPDGMAGFFDGDVVVTRNVIVSGDVFLQGADCAEEFDVCGSGGLEPGSVLVIDEDGNSLRESDQAYDCRVAGVVSGAGAYRPGLTLDHRGRHCSTTRAAVALVGKVFCKADASYGTIKVGDLLTSSPTRGHAMRADDRDRAFGAVIGKALQPLTDGSGLIPVLIALQ